MLRRLLIADASGGTALTAWNPGYLSPSATVAAANTELRAATTATYANSRSLSPLSGDVYFSARCEKGLAANYGFGITDAAVSLTSAGRYTGDQNSIGLWYEGRVYMGGTSIHMPGALTASVDIEVAVRVASRRIWLRRSGGAWIGGGDPAANTTPTGTLGGTGALYIAGSLDPRAGGTANALIRLPTNPVGVTGVAPAGFTVGVP